MMLNELKSKLHLKLAQVVPKGKTKEKTPATFKPRSIIVFRKKANPTFAYYLEDRLSYYSSQMPVIVRCIDHDNLDDIDPAGAFVIICRYLRAKHVDWLNQNRSDLCGIGMLVDDDIPAVITGAEATFPYRFSLVRWHVVPMVRLRGKLDIIWASTPPLAARLAADNLAVRLLPPLPRREDIGEVLVRPPSVGGITMGYYATGIHIKEHAFLASFIPDLLAQYPQVTFEVAADRRVRQLWERLAATTPQIRFASVVPWTQFSQRTDYGRLDIALVPLLAGLVNDARADTKRMDVCRQGAAAVFSNVTAYERNRHQDELLVENTPQSWRLAIETLINSDTTREKARLATRAALVKLRSEADFTIPGLVASAEAW